MNIETLPGTPFGPRARRGSDMTCYGSSLFHLHKTIEELNTALHGGAEIV
jgi:hypothetical protein